MTDDFVTVAIPRSALNITPPPPRTATQKTAREIFGLSPEDFLRCLGRFRAAGNSVGVHGKLRVVDVDAFRAWLLAQAPAPGGKKRDAKPPAAADSAPSDFLASVGLREVRR